MQIYISYSWKQPSKSIVRNWLHPILKQAYIDCCIDEQNCGYGQDIEKFEQEIGHADKVIVVVGRTYLHSIECMYEFARIIEHGNLQNRLIPVCLDDFERSLAEGKQIYQYWKNQKEELAKMIEEDEKTKNLFEKELSRLTLILTHFAEAWEYIRKTNTSTFERLSSNNFNLLISHIKNEQNMDNVPMAEMMTDIPLEPEELASTINITQHGQKSITQVINSGTSIINL